MPCEQYEAGGARAGDPNQLRCGEGGEREGEETSRKLSPACTFQEQQLPLSHFSEGDGCPKISALDRFPRQEVEVMRTSFSGDYTLGCLYYCSFHISAPEFWTRCSLNCSIV